MPVGRRESINAVLWLAYAFLLQIVRCISEGEPRNAQLGCEFVLGGGLLARLMAPGFDQLVQTEVCLL